MPSSTPDLSEFHELAADRHHKPPCKVATALEGLAESDVTNATGALAADPSDVTAGAIERWFKRRNLVVSQNAITVHRKGRCKCGTGR